MWMLLAACSGDDPVADSSLTDADADADADADTDADTDADADADTGFETYDATWVGVQELFVDHCDRCHPAQQGLDLHEDIPTDMVGAYPRFVVAGDASASTLWGTVSGENPYLSPMPYDTDLLPIEVVRPIQVWIDAGAPLE